MNGYKFASRGRARTELGTYKGVGARVVNDNRKPVYMVLIADTSTSMSGASTVVQEDGEAVLVSKIEQLNDGIKRFVGTLKDLEANDPLCKANLQIIELNSYGKAVFPAFQPLSRNFEEVKFEASGCTELRASLATLKTFISSKYLRDDRPGREGKGYNSPIFVTLMSDGWPTDANGITQTREEYRAVIDEFKKELDEKGYGRHIVFVSIAVGDDACEDMLRYFCDGDGEESEQSHFYRVEESESIGDILVFATCDTWVRHTTVPLFDDLYDEDEDELDDEEELDGEDELDDEELDDENEDEDEGEVLGVQGDKALMRAANDVYQIDIVKCKKSKCMMCLHDKCPTDAIEVHSGIVSIDPTKCVGCGLCESECPYNAIYSASADATLDDLFDDIQ